MAITNAQQFKQLVNPPMEGKKRPGYRGDDAARSSEGTSAGRADPGGAGRGDTRGDPGPVERDTGLERARQRNINLLDNFKSKKPEVNFPGFFGSIFKEPIQKFADFTAKKNRPFFEDVIRAGRIPGLNFGTVSNMTEEELEEAYQNYDRARLSGEIDAYGNPKVQTDGNDAYIFPTSGIMAEAPSDTDQEPEVEEPFQLSRRFRAEGGIMNSDVVGGEFDFESARQMYGLGKLVKKVTKTVKKIAKSPIGKAAIAAATIKFGGPLAAKAFPSTFGTTASSPFLRAIGRGQFFTNQAGIPGIFRTAGEGLGILARKVGSGKNVDFVREGIFSNLGVGSAIFGASALAGLLTPKQEEEAQDLARGEGIDIEEARRSILNAGTPQDFRARRFVAEGGSMKEPVAKKTMPLLDMGGKEMDLREDGGFVPIGRMEKADDVPARLSKNEFVFTADAVRNAGDGDVDKGAEVMYNMMKNLESGGDVSEESQGLEGARKMFQTSQRLEEVL